ncbi:MAG: hypothetical protein JWM88_2662 [Verrucomicrobia bacterium]|nr:hypothetical protein [Verrucomicrobiota bacterium]
MRKIQLPVLLLILGAAALASAAGMMLFSSFMLYDDEGYVLLSLRNFAEHGGLYREVYTQYGPFSYVLYYFLHALGMPFTHDAGRVLTLAAWTGTATLSAWTVWCVTRHSACMLATLSAVFVYLWIMISEPNHPGGLVALTTAIMGLAGYRALENGRWRTWSALAGAGCAVLVLTKINVGAFAVLSSAAVLLLHSRQAAVRRAMPWILGAGLLLLPFALMRPLLGAPWVQTYALLFAFAAIPVAGSFALGFAADPDPRAKAEPQSRSGAGAAEWGMTLAAGCAVACIVLGVIFVRGTKFSDLVQGVLLGPLHHPGHFSLVFPWPPAVRQVGAVSCAAFLLALGGLRLGRPRRATLDTVIALLRLAAAGGLVVAMAQFPRISPDNLVFAYSISSLWLFVWPLSGESASTVTARGWLALLFLGQWLHPYPVPGSQIAWGTFLYIPLVVLGSWQAARWLSGRWSPVLTRMRPAALDMLFTLGLAAMAILMGNRLAQIGSRYLESRSLDLPGAGALRLPDSTSALYRLLVENAKVHGDVLFSLPGMFSFNLWSGLPPPTLTNVTHWFSLLDDEQQHAIIRSLQSHPRACVIVQAPHLDFLRQRDLTPGGPLYDYIMAEFETAFALDGFEFRVHRGRRIVPLLTAEIFQAKPAGNPDPAILNTLIKVQLMPSRPVASIEIAQMDDRRSAPFVLNGSNTRVEVAPINLDGSPRAPSAPRAFPFALDGAAEVALYFDRNRQVFSAAQNFLVLRDAAGDEIALVRLRP